MVLRRGDGIPVTLGSHERPPVSSERNSVVMLTYKRQMRSTVTFVFDALDSSFTRRECQPSHLTTDTLTPLTRRPMASVRNAVLFTSHPSPSAQPEVSPSHPVVRRPCLTTVSRPSHVHVLDGENRECPSCPLQRVSLSSHGTLKNDTSSPSSPIGSVKYHDAPQN